MYWLWDGEIIQKERMCVWNRCCWCPSYIFPCYFPFLSEHATFCLIFSLATGVDGGGVRELVSGRASFRLVEKYSSSLWSGSPKHFLFLPPRVSPVRLGPSCLQKSPAQYHTPPWLPPFPLSLSHPSAQLWSFPNKSLRLIVLSHCQLREECKPRQWLTEC